MRGEKRQAKLVEINNSMIQAVSNPTQKLFLSPIILPATKSSAKQARPQRPQIP